jgi:hypothetical protein
MRSENLPGIKRPFDVSIRRTRHALADRPSGTVVVLRLHGAKPGHNVSSRAQLRRAELLIVKSLSKKIRGSHT